MSDKPLFLYLATHSFFTFIKLTLEVKVKVHFVLKIEDALEYVDEDAFAAVVGKNDLIQLLELLMKASRLV